jgi:2-octaprenyl-6-methoxyphenol hydroxylase
MTAHSAPPENISVAVVGGGVTGMAAALALARGGAEVALIVRGLAAPADFRTAALFPASVQLLRHLGVWEPIEAQAAPLEAIRIIDATSWPLKAPETVFWAHELDQAALAWNIPNAVLTSALLQAVRQSDRIRHISTAETPAYHTLTDGIGITTREGERLTAQLVVAADGRSSPLRQFAGIGSHETKHDQTALVTSFRHSRPHHGISNEIHRDAGPLTTVPMPAGAEGAQRSSLVWVERPREVARLMGLETEAFRVELQDKLQGLLGRIDDINPRMTFPLTTLGVDQFAKGRIALVGESAHVLPPIGAQGLNLGLRDVAELAEALLWGANRGKNSSHGGQLTRFSSRYEGCLSSYNQARKLDAGSRGRGVDLLNASLASGLLPLQLARGFGLHIIGRIGPLKRAVMRGGANGLAPLPSLMREDFSSVSRAL